MTPLTTVITATSPLDYYYLTWLPDFLLYFFFAYQETTEGLESYICNEGWVLKPGTKQAPSTVMLAGAHTELIQL